MKLTVKIVAYTLFLISAFGYGQMEQYQYKRELKGVTDQWHNIILPNDIFSKVSKDFNDIRIFGITTENDTIEAPYSLRIAEEMKISMEVHFKVINTSYNTSGYYFTFEIPTPEFINQIRLNFDNQNFDWKVKLEGSQNQNEWFIILENYRILSIKNELVDFQFNKLDFPNSKYKYLRLHIKSDQKPKLTTTSITRNEIAQGIHKKYAILDHKTKENKQAKQTEIDIELQEPVPVNNLKIAVKDTFDYYRKITVKYLTDSLKIEKGWKYNYKALTTGTLNSFEENVFTFKSTILKKLKVQIHNYDNQPLHIDTVEISGNTHELISRFTTKATYFLTYGKTNASKPNYDITKFIYKIPNNHNLSSLELAGEQIISKKDDTVVTPLFKNKVWLWLIMILIIIVLGGFSLKMMKKK